MFTIKFYFFGLIFAVLLIISGGVPLWLVYGLYLNTILMCIFQVTVWPLELSRTEKSPKSRSLLKEALLATLITVAATLLTIDSKAGIAPYFLVMSGIIVFHLTGECAKELTKILPKIKN